MADRELQEPPFDDQEQQYGSHHVGGSRNKGYAPLPTEELPPPYEVRRSVPRMPYPPPAPLQPIQQQQSSSNVVVVGNQPQPQRVSVVRMRTADDHLIVTILLFLCCLFLGNFPVMLCLFPALIFSCMASTYNDAGHHTLAEHFGSLACKCNIAAVIPAIVLMVVGAVAGIVVILLAVGVIGSISDNV